MLMKKMSVKQITNWTAFGKIQTATTSYNIHHMFNTFPLNLTSIQKSPQNPHWPMRIHHSPHTHPIPTPMGISMEILIPTAALAISRVNRRRTIHVWSLTTKHPIAVKFCVNRTKKIQHWCTTNFLPFVGEEHAGPRVAFDQHTCDSFSHHRV